MKQEKLQKFAELLEREQLEDLERQGLTCADNTANCKIEIKPGRKYIKIDEGYSGKYMIDKEGNIYGIKAYGVIHKGHYYGTLDTIEDYYWGGYRAVKKGDLK